MSELKRISQEGVETALDKADHYRLLNEPLHAESICRDVLEVESENQRALVTLLLALTDQFPTRLQDAHHHAVGLLPGLHRDYDKHYYEGIINERWACTQISRGMASRSVPEWLGRAMHCYEQAQALTSDQNPDPVLRYNTCARLKDKLLLRQPAAEPLTRDIQTEFGEDVPPHSF